MEMEQKGTPVKTLAQPAYAGSDTAAQMPRKKEYRPPLLERLGPLEELTQGGNGAFSDAPLAGTRAF